MSIREGRANDVIADAELDVMCQTYHELATLDRGAQRRVLSWLNQRLRDEHVTQHGEDDDLHAARGKGLVF